MGLNRYSRRWRALGAALAVVALALLGITARLFVWPARGMPDRVDAIVMMNGPGDRLATALQLARDGRAPVVVIARGSAYWGHGSVCAPRITGVRFICFMPDPSTTRGEAEFAGRLAARYHWHSIALVTTAPQTVRARLRLSRCFAGQVYAVDAPLSAGDWLLAIPYEWAATGKAELLQRSC